MLYELLKISCNSSFQRVGLIIKKHIIPLIKDSKSCSSPLCGKGLIESLFDLLVTNSLLDFNWFTSSRLECHSRIFKPPLGPMLEIKRALRGLMRSQIYLETLLFEDAGKNGFYSRSRCHVWYSKAIVHFRPADQSSKSGEVVQISKIGRDNEKRFHAREWVHHQLCSQRSSFLRYYSAFKGVQSSSRASKPSDNLPSPAYQRICTSGESIPSVFGLSTFVCEYCPWHYKRWWFPAEVCHISLRRVSTHNAERLVL